MQSTERVQWILSCNNPLDSENHLIIFQYFVTFWFFSNLWRWSKLNLRKQENETVNKSSQLIFTLSSFCMFDVHMKPAEGKVSSLTGALDFFLGRGGAILYLVPVCELLFTLISCLYYFNLINIDEENPPFCCHDLISDEVPPNIFLFSLKSPAVTDQKGTIYFFAFALIFLITEYSHCPLFVCEDKSPFMIRLCWFGSFWRTKLKTRF